MASSCAVHKPSDTYAYVSFVCTGIKPIDTLIKISKVDGTWNGSEQLRELHDTYDSLLRAVRKHDIFYGYYEPIKSPDFVPSYKKVENRNRLQAKL